MAFTPNPSVAVILVNWNGFDFTEACLSSLREVSYPNFKVILVDNASSNSEGLMLKEKFPEIDLIQSTENRGFAGGNNLGIKKALKEKYAYVLLLNNDTEVEADFLGELLCRFQTSPRVGLVQPLILFHHDVTQIWSAGGKWDSSLGRAITLGDRKPKDAYDAKNQALDWATGCCILIRSDALEQVGGLNECYFAYFEDVEWSLRFRERGFEIRLAASAEIYHHAGASSKSKHSEGTLSPLVFYYHVRNQIFLIRSQVAYPAKVLAFAYHLVRFTIWMSYFALRGRIRKMKSVARGVRDGFLQSFQPAEKWL